jgi:ribonuclease E
MAATKTSGSPNKSSFIRQHPTLSAADVIAAGKAAGIKFTSSLVYMVRGRQDGKASSKKTTAKKTITRTTSSKKASTKKSAAKKTSPAAKPVASKTTTSKADFVRERAHLFPKGA